MLELDIWNLSSHVQFDLRLVGVADRIKYSKINCISPHAHVFFSPINKNVLLESCMSTYVTFRGEMLKSVVGMVV